MDHVTMQLLTNPVAAQFAASLPAIIDPAVLAEKYRILSAHDDKTSAAMCLAIEHHVRTMATIDFMNPAVLSALQCVERDLALRTKRTKSNKAKAYRRRENARKLAAQGVEKNED